MKKFIYIYVITIVVTFLISLFSGGNHWNDKFVAFGIYNLFVGVVMFFVGLIIMAVGKGDLGKNLLLASGLIFLTGGIACSGFFRLN